MKNNRGRPPIDPEIIIHIEDKVRFNRRLEPSKRLSNKELAKHLETEIPEKLKKPSPMFATLLKKISEVAKDEPGSIDILWSVLDIVQHPIPPEALPTILEAWNREALKGSYLTIRQALWISRLYYIFKEAGELDTKLPLLITFAMRYAGEERFFERTGEYYREGSPFWNLSRWNQDVLLYGVLGLKKEGWSAHELLLAFPEFDKLSPATKEDIIKDAKAIRQGETEKEAQNER